MNTADQVVPKCMNFGVALAISFVLFNLGFVISETIRWTDHIQGLQNGAFHILFLGFAWCMYGIPWYVLGCLIFRKRNWLRHRVSWVIAPSFLMFVFFLATLAIDPPTASHRFKQFAKTELPGNLQEFHYRFAGGGIADYSDTYYFKTTPEEMVLLIAGMRLEPDEFYGRHDKRYSLPGCPEVSEWKGVRQYRRVPEGEGADWFYYLVTDETKTQAYVWIGCN